MKIERQVTVIAEANIAAGERERVRGRGFREGETLLMRVKLS
jgi:hypothetical protein